jgi:hypothetical protein
VPNLLRKRTITPPGAIVRHLDSSAAVHIPVHLRDICELFFYFLSNFLFCYFSVLVLVSALFSSLVYVGSSIIVFAINFL